MLNNKNKVVIKTCLKGRICHVCKKKINKGTEYILTGYEQCYTNICKKCINKLCKEINK